MTTTREVEAARVERRRRGSRLYKLSGSKRCLVCDGPLGLVEPPLVHPTCEPGFAELVALSRRAEEALQL